MASFAMPVNLTDAKVTQFDVIVRFPKFPRFWNSRIVLTALATALMLHLRFEERWGIEKTIKSLHSSIQLTHLLLCQWGHSYPLLQRDGHTLADQHYHKSRHNRL